MTSDLGVLLDERGQPVLPGSSIKGKLRSTCESLAHAFGLSACLLNSQFSGVPCCSDVAWYSQGQHDRYARAVASGPETQLAWIEQNTCDVCKLFGSPVRAGRLRCSDGLLDTTSASLVVSVRDGVVLDRDSHTAVDGLKYDYEIASAGSRFHVFFDLENPRQEDEVLLGAALFEWSAGSTLGGFTSRGLGRFHLENIVLRGVDMDVPQERLRFLTGATPSEKLSDKGDWKTYFQQRIDAQLELAGKGA